MDPDRRQVMEGGYRKPKTASLVDEKLLAEIRGLAGEIGADTVVPVYDDGIVEEFRLYICKTKGSVL